MLKTSIQSEKAFFLRNVNSETMNNLEIIQMSFYKSDITDLESESIRHQSSGGFSG